MMSSKKDKKDKKDKKKKDAKDKKSDKSSKAERLKTEKSSKRLKRFGSMREKSDSRSQLPVVIRSSDRCHTKVILRVNFYGTNSNVSVSATKETTAMDVKDIMLKKAPRFFGNSASCSFFGWIIANKGEVLSAEGSILEQTGYDAENQASMPDLQFIPIDAVKAVIEVTGKDSQYRCSGDGVDEREDVSVLKSAFAMASSTSRSDMIPGRRKTATSRGLFSRKKSTSVRKEGDEILEARQIVLIGQYNNLLTLACEETLKQRSRLQNVIGVDGGKKRDEAKAQENGDGAERRSSIAFADQVEVAGRDTSSPEPAGADGGSNGFDFGGSDDESPKAGGAKLDFGGSDEEEEDGGGGGAKLDFGGSDEEEDGGAGPKLDFGGSDEEDSSLGGGSSLVAGAAYGMPDEDDQDPFGRGGGRASPDMFAGSDDDDGGLFGGAGDAYLIPDDDDDKISFVEPSKERKYEKKSGPTRSYDPDMSQYLDKSMQKKGMVKRADGRFGVNDEVADSERKLASETKDKISTYLDKDSTEYDTMDFNQRFQSITENLARFDANLRVQREAMIRDVSALIGLAQDFLYSAQAYGKIIISEVYVPNEDKTIKPVNIGGVAGGSKYIAGEILFKFAMDTEGLYGHDHGAAATVAGHELKGLQAYYNCNIQGLCFPLMALVDYRGFRLIANSLLPLGKDTLIYGTNDGGNTMHNDDEALAEMMKKASVMLNLAEHEAGLHKDKRIVVHAAADLEGHRGTDDRFYLLDFSRTFPPETPEDKTPGRNLTHLLRHEFLHSLDYPLCPDAYSGFADGSIHNKAVDEASRTLQWKIIPQFARDLPGLFVKAQMEDELDIPTDVRARASSSTTHQTAQLDTFSRFRLTEVVHAHGINIRYLGVMYTFLNKVEASTARDNCRALLLGEMVARVMKKQLRSRMRMRMEMLTKPLELPHRILLVNYLNLAFGKSQLSTQYWDVDLKDELVAKFSGFILHQPQGRTFKELVAELIRDSPGVSSDWRWVILNRVRQMMGFEFSPRIIEALMTNEDDVFDNAEPLSLGDIQKIGERIKFMSTISHAEGILHMHNGRHLLKTNPLRGIEVLSLAVQKFGEVLNSSPFNIASLRDCAHVLIILDEAIRAQQEVDTKKKKKDKDRDDSPSESSRTIRAKKYLNRAMQIDGRDPKTLFVNALYEKHMERYNMAESSLIDALDTYPLYLEALGILTELIEGTELHDLFMLYNSVFSQLASYNHDMWNKISTLRPRAQMLKKKPDGS